MKVLDFGLAKSTMVDPDATVSRSGVVIGTFSHIAPECLSDPSRTSARSDLYSLGCVAYELLSGREVFASADQTASWRPPSPPGPGSFRRGRPNGSDQAAHRR